MKILQIIYGLGPAGAERFVVDLSNELAKQGNEVTLYVFDDNGNNGFYKNEISNNISYISAKIPTGFRFSNFISIYR